MSNGDLSSGQGVVERGVITTPKPPLLNPLLLRTNFLFFFVIFGLILCFMDSNEEPEPKFHEHFLININFLFIQTVL